MWGRLLLYKFISNAIGNITAVY